MHWLRHNRRSRTCLRRLLWPVSVLGIGLLSLFCFIIYPPPQREITFPHGKAFAFTIVDDTDMATLERIRPVYEVLDRYGLRTTKTVWVLESAETYHAPNQGDSLQEPAYRDFILDLQSKGFEIGLHGIRGGSSKRAEILRGLEEFRRILGRDPTLHVNHSLNRDNLYWGEHRWSFAPFRWLYALRKGPSFTGHDYNSPRFWGDAALERVRYVNQFTFSNINLLEVTSSFPYHLPEKPYVNFWFPTSNGKNLDALEILLSNANLDRLEREGGVCLVYTHLGAGSFNTPDGVNPRFEVLMREVASRNGWFAPASEILAHLEKQPGWRATPGWRETIRLEVLFLWDLLTN